MQETSNEVVFWSQVEAITYYSHHRNTKDDLYSSEREYINNDLFALGSHLDVGCAVGGLAAIAKSANKDILFTGVDISPTMIEQARNLHPDCEFHTIDGATLPFADNAFASVTGLSVLVLTQGWVSLLYEMWRVCKNVAIFDVRLRDKTMDFDFAKSYQTLKCAGCPEDKKIPYRVLLPEELRDVLCALKPHPYRIDIQGYMRPPSSSSYVPLKEVCMTMVRCIKDVSLLKDANSLQAGIYWDMPMDKPIQWIQHE